MAHLIEQRFTQEELAEELKRMLRGAQDDLLATNPNFFPNKSKAMRRHEASKHGNWKRKEQAYKQILELIRWCYLGEKYAFEAQAAEYERGLKDAKRQYPASVNREFVKQWIETMPGTWRPDEYICQFISEQCGIIITEKPKGEADG